MKKSVLINGVYYTPKKSTPYYNGKSSIFDLYKTPSSTKIKIFNEWEKKLNLIYGLCGNSNTFSIYGNVRDENGVLHNVWITRSNNYILD